MKIALAAAALLILSAPSRASGPERASAEAFDGFAAAASAPRFTPGVRAPQVCSELDFGGVTWPSTLTDDDRAALEIALNISGSYEGGDAWANITDNFDGQGLSLGLLNQCLGQGSLQPLLIRLRDEHPERIAALLSPEHRRSLLGMLAKWQSSAAEEDSALMPLSPLDNPGEAAQPMALAANNASVEWAVANLYAGGKFIPQWKRELSELASSREYVSLQIAAGVANHERAVALEKTVGVRELRDYLFLYDLYVQNGGPYSSDITEYADFVRRNPGADGTARLEKFLELRLRHVRPKYEADVRARKNAIIRGKGTVHGEPRNLPGQYCYDGLWPYR